MTSPHPAHVAAWEAKALSVLARQQGRELQVAQSAVERGAGRSVKAALKETVQASNLATCQRITEMKQQNTMSAIDAGTTRSEQRALEDALRDKKRKEKLFRDALQKRDDRETNERQLRGAYNRVKQLEADLAGMAVSGAAAARAFTPASPPRFKGSPPPTGSPATPKASPSRLHRGSPATPRSADAAIVAIARMQVDADKPYIRPSRVKWR